MLPLHCITVAALASAWVLAFAAPASAQVSSLAGETLEGPATGFADCGTSNHGGAVVTYRAEGAASGPYPGTFVEEGTMDFDTFRWDSTFTIHAVTGEVVTGTRRLIVLDWDLCHPGRVQLVALMGDQT